MVYGDASRAIALSGVTHADLGLDDDGALTGLADALLDQAAGLIDTYCGRDFALHEDVEETLDGNGRDRIRLAGFPVSALTTVTLDGRPLTEGTDFYVKTDAGILVRMDGGTWTRGFQNLAVVYSYGYAVPPPAIVRLAEEMAISALQKGKRDRQIAGGVASVSMDGFSISFSAMAAAMNLTAEMQQVLDRFRVTGGA
ncbi:MAG: hypothetical protein QMC96_12490 [Methanomicrobiales archaeon]|nr:hypothetical protein [Methanomicrobiales archaeon]